MEDQQSAAGDLTGPEAGPATDEQASAEHEVAESGAAEQVTAAKPRHRMPVGKSRRQPPQDNTAATASDDPVDEPEMPKDQESPGDPLDPAEPEAQPVTDGVDDELPEPAATENVVFVERKRAGRWAPAAVGVIVALFIGAGAFAGAAAAPYLADRAEVDTKFEVARTAAQAITTLWTYTPENMESLADRSARFLGGDFEAQYRKYVDAIAPTNKQAQVSNNTEVVGTAVESLDGTHATAIVYTNSTATSPLTKNIPSLRYLSYRLNLERRDAKWLVTKMTTITSLDLTPQL